MTLQEKALITIEGLTLAVGCEILKVKEYKYMLEEIYKYAHIGQGGCKHKDWEAELDKTYKQLKKDRVI